MHHMSGKSEGKDHYKKTKVLQSKQTHCAYKEINKNSDLKIKDLFYRSKDIITAAVLLEKSSIYNFECYKDITNPKVLVQIKNRYNNTKEKEPSSTCKIQQQVDH